MTNWLKRLRSAVVTAILMVPLLMDGAGAGAAQATLEPSRDIPNPTECQIEPLSLPLFDSIPVADMPSLDSSPATPQSAMGEPADEATLAAITATVRESIACANAGDLRRQFAFFSDRLLLDIFTGPDAADLPAFEAAVESPPRPFLPTDRLALVEVREVRLLPDGRVTAIVVTESPITRYEDSLTFVEVDGRWLIDEVKELTTEEITTGP